MSISLHLVSDLDGTWIPSEGNLGSLRGLEALLVANPGIVLTFATGRSLSSALSAIAASVNVLPQHFVTDVGTAIYHRMEDGGWAEDPEYATWVESRWDTHLLDETIEGWLPLGVRRQPDVFAPRRLALEVESDQDVHRAAEALRTILKERGMVVDVLATGRCLDVLPMGVDKGAAAAFLQTHLPLPRPMVACGDSENDIALFQVADHSILMADSPLDLKFPGMPQERILRASGLGPLGILQVLLSLTTERVEIR
ncbi:MAG: HAD-IIB family hydrolase [Holophaga sp.]|nr:HAD-IIB family hydrolase [Holophaga sp.]